MSAEVTIATGVAGRVLANIACATNPRLGAGLVGLSNGFLIHRAWVANTLLDPLTLLVLAAGLVFDHSMYGEFENAVTGVLACGLGVVLADFGPDLWYELVGEEVTKELSRELEALGLGSFASGYDSSSSDVDVDERSDVVTTVSRSSRRTSRTVAARPGRPRATPRQAPSTTTRLSRVTFDESSITPSQSDDADTYVEDLFTTNGDALSASTGTVDDLYLEPSSTGTASTSRTVTQQAVRRPSILRRLHIPRQDATTTNATTTTLRSASGSSTASSSSRTRLTSDGETTPRATTRPDFTPTTLTSSFEPGLPPISAAPSFPEPDLTSSATSSSVTYEEYSPRVIPPSEPTPDLSTSIALPEPVHFLPGPSAVDPSPISVIKHEAASSEENHGDHRGTSRLIEMMNSPIVPREERAESQYQYNVNGRPESPESAARLSIPPSLQTGLMRSRSRSGSRTRSRSPAGPRPQPSPHHESQSLPPPMPAPVTGAYGPPEYISETPEDTTVDVRDLSREDAISRIEEGWSRVENRRHRRLNVLTRHDDDELESQKNSTFHLMEDLENLRFNFKIRPGIIIITSRSRG